MGHANLEQMAIAQGELCARLGRLSDHRIAALHAHRVPHCAKRPPGLGCRLARAEGLGCTCKLDLQCKRRHIVNTASGRRMQGCLWSQMRRLLHTFSNQALGMVCRAAKLIAEQFCSKAHAAATDINSAGAA